MNKIYWAGYHPERSVQAKGIFYLKKKLEEIYPNNLEFKFVSDIGDLKYNAIDLLRLVEEGEIDCCYFFSSYLTERVEELNLFEIPFQISSRDQVYNLLDGSVGDYISQKVEDNTGYKVLGYWDNGIRHISSNNRHMKSLEDCKASSIRIANNKMHEDVFRAIGFEPKFIDVKKLKNAVITGEVNTQENPLTNIINYGIEDYHPYITLSSHLFGTSILLCNKKKFYDWNQDFRDHLQEQLKEATKYQRALAMQEDVTCMKLLKEKGTKIMEIDPNFRNQLKSIAFNIGETEIKKFPKDIQQKFDELI